MATKILNIQDYPGYIKCGEILKSPLPNYEYPFILKCFQCDKINFILESFIIHIQEHCGNNLDLKDDIDIKIPNEEETESEPIENPIVKIEELSMEVDDPLVVIKDEIIEDNPQEAETTSNTLEDKEDFEDYSSNSEEDFQTDDAETGEEEEMKYKPTKKKERKKKNTLPPAVEEFIKSKQNMKILIDLYRNQPNLWNKDLPFYRFRDKRQGFIEETTKDLNNKLNLVLTSKDVADIIAYIYRKHRDDFKRLQFYEEEEKTLKDTKYKRCWFYDELDFLRPKEVLQINKLDTTDLTADQTKKIIQIYRDTPNLWNSNLIEFICTNKRHEAHNEMLKNLETNMNISVSVTVLEEYLRTIHSYFSKEKRIRNKKIYSKSNSGSNDYYDHLMFLYDHEGPFNCSGCKRSFLKPLPYKVHKSSHDDSVPFTCSQCNKQFKTIPTYTVHAKRHFEDLEFACSVCERKFIAYADLRVHLLTHSGDRPYFCEICGTSYRHIQCFKRHQRRHDKRYTHTCHICSKGYYSKDRLIDHMNAHMNIRSYICQLCGKGFITKRALNTHSVTHDDARNHACKLCGKTFKLKIGVLQHMRTHGSRFETTEDKN